MVGKHIVKRAHTCLIASVILLQGIGYYLVIKYNIIIVFESHRQVFFMQYISIKSLPKSNNIGIIRWRSQTNIYIVQFVTEFTYFKQINRNKYLSNPRVII